jgi:hypothetical protein
VQKVIIPDDTVKLILEKYKKNAHFSGTSQEVLEYLQKELLISTV